MSKKYIYLLLCLLIASCDQKKTESPQSSKKTEQNTSKISKVNIKSNVNVENTASIDDLKRDIQQNSSLNSNFTSGGVSNNELITDNPLSTLNSVRSKIGIQPLYVNNSLNYAADKHAEYLVSNNVASHEEFSNMKNFYGQWPVDRARNAGYMNGYSNVVFNIGEVLTLSEDSPSQGLNALMGAIYHRLILLDPDYNEIGYSTQLSSNKFALSMLLANKQYSSQLPDLKLSYYPYNNSYVQTSFRPADEIPNPVPEKQEVGYPISVELPAGYPLNLSHFSMVESNSGDVIQGKFLTNKTDNEVKENEFAFIPWEPLKENTKYTVSIQGKTTGANINFTWFFYTLTKTPFTAIPDNKVYHPGDLLNVNYKMSDGNQISTSVNVRDARNELLQSIKNQPWGTLSYKVLPGCLDSNGCKVNFVLKNNVGQQTSFQVLITP